MKGNLLLGTARGKLGDVVFYRQRAKQMARVRVTKVANPRTLPQVVQRVVFNTCIQAYSVMQDICNHSFQGMQRSVENQAEFMKINVRLLNNKIALSADPKKCRAFLRRDDKGLAFNQYQIAKGNLPVVALPSSNVDFLTFLQFTADEQNLYDYSYQDIAERLGVPVGSQVTVCLLIGERGVPEHNHIFSFGRFVLSPADGDVSKPFFKVVTGNESLIDINDPNVDNTITQMEIEGASGQARSITMQAGITINGNQFYGYNYRSGDIIAYSLITSQYVNGVWRRSDSFLMPVGNGEYNEDTYYTLEEAADSYQKGVWSSRYLNQGTTDGGLLGVEDEWNGIKERYPEQYSVAAAMSEAMAYDGEGEAETQDPVDIAREALTRKRRRKDTE